MQEGESGESERRGKFASARDEVLYTLSTAGWCNESSGDVQATTGWFARISIDQSELEEVFGVVVDEVTLDDTAKLIGHFLLLEDEQGFVTVSAYDDPDELRRHYRMLNEAYGEWLGNSDV